MHRIWESLANLDRRWLFALTFVVVGLPLLTGIVLKQKVSPMTEDVFHAIDDLPDGSKILMAVDYDPASEGELEPMAKAFLRHCAEKKHKLYYMTVWPQGVGMIQRQTALLKDEYPDYEYGVDYVNLGYGPGQDGAVESVVNGFSGLYDSDQKGTPLSKIPMMEDVGSIQDIPLIINVSAGDPGLKQWIQYASTPYESVEIVAGTTGVQASPLYPYIPNQMIGMLVGLKQAAEYETLLLEKYPQLLDRPDANLASALMTSQETAHFMLIAIIILGNIVMWKTGQWRNRT
jgi:hypothetical protein